MKQIVATLKQKSFEGDIDDTVQTRDFYSHDASMFELMPQIILFPKNAKDVEIGRAHV